MARDELVQNVEILFGFAVQTDNSTAFDCGTGDRIIRAFKDLKSGFGVFGCKKIMAEHSFVPIGKAPPAIGVSRVGHGLSPRWMNS